MYLDDCVCVLPDLTWLPLLGVGRKSWYIIIIINSSHYALNKSLTARPWILVYANHPLHCHLFQINHTNCSLCVTFAGWNWMRVRLRLQYPSLQVTHNASPVICWHLLLLTIGGTVLKESDDLDILIVTFDSTMTFESIFAQLTEQLLKGLPGIPWYDWFLVDVVGVLSWQFWSPVLQYGARQPIYTLNYWAVLSVEPV